MTRHKALKQENIYEFHPVSLMKTNPR